ncbi:hypothetical protein P7K49_034225 [Saguinus oedipus]|uniref:WD repeat-containing protein 87 n=1 Tax=Saguinus oedipus TaxID=9490 RepID=A0ABQ9TU55_SAGOE|nr:hypothetical protein P7K49_034225 [Saguinus oedipus]
MSIKSWDVTRKSSSPRLIPEWKNLNFLIKKILKDIKIGEEPKNDVVVLSDWPETLYQESHHPQNKPFICYYYSIKVNCFISLNWMEPYGKMQAVLWIQKTGTEMKGMIEKMRLRMMDQLPPIQAMVHTGSYHMLVAYCGDICLRLFGDHRRGFRFLGTVPCHFSVSCLFYDPETELLLSGTLGAVVTWFILPNGRDIKMAQIVPMANHELVQGFSMNGPQGSLFALCEDTVKVFIHRGQGQLEEVKKFTPVASGSSITCSFACVSQGNFYAGNRAGEIHAWGLDQGNFLHSFQAHSSSVICIHSRPEIHTLLTAGSEGVVREWNLTYGNLLRQLNIDNGLQKLQFIDNTTFFCQTTYGFSLHHLPYFYSLFHVCGSAPQQVQRVYCGHNWTRILCATEDGLLRFLSPVTGDLLVITWPLLVMDKAVAWSYDSEREELFVAIGSSEVLVFDATCSPCTAKYLVCTSADPKDTVRCLAYGRSHLHKGLGGLMFCGHDSGIVRILSHYSCARIEKTVHSGAVLALSTLEGPQENALLCSYGVDNIIHLTEAVLQVNRVVLQPVSKILCGCPLKHVILLPGSVGAITESYCWHLWHYEGFLTSSESKQSFVLRETKRLHECDITSFDVCLSLKLFVTGGIDGSVRIWDFHGRLVTEFDSALHFGPLCFANNRGDLLLTFNQSIYIVSCLKLLPPAQLTNLCILKNADEIQEVPKPFFPSFFFMFETVFVPRFVYLGKGRQELRGLEALVNKRFIAFDNTVPHVIEEERCKPLVIQKKSIFPPLENEDIDLSTLDSKHNHPRHGVPAQLRLAGWDGLNAYQMLRCFFGQGRQWPFAPDGYIPNSVIRARLWPEGTPVFLSCDPYSSYQVKDWKLSSMTLVEENISRSKLKDKSKERKGSFLDILESMAKQNWMTRKESGRLMDDLVEGILNLTIYCSVEEYKRYFRILQYIFATCQISPALVSKTAYCLLQDTTHSNPQIRELAWEALDRLGLMNHYFAIPLAMGLMDSDENVRAKALYIMVRVTGIQTKTRLVRLLKKEGTLQKMQQEIIGEVSLGQLLNIQAEDIQSLLTAVEQQLNENLNLLQREKPFTFSFDMPWSEELKVFSEEMLVPLSEPVKITKEKKRKQRFKARSRKLSMYGVMYVKRDLRVTRKQKKTKLEKSSSVLTPSEDAGEETKARKSEQFETQDVVLEPELPLSTLSEVQSQDDAETEEEVILQAIEAMEATDAMEAIDQGSMKDDGFVVSKLEKKERIKRLWKKAMRKGLGIADVERKEKPDLKDISEVTTEEPKEEVIKIDEQKEGKRKKHERKKRGLAGTPGRVGRPDTRSWRDDICSLVTSRIASSQPGMLRDLGKELVDLAEVILADRQPSWNLFQEICPLLKDSSSVSLELDDRVVEETPTITKKVIKGDDKDKRTAILTEQEDKKGLKEDEEFSQEEKKAVFPADRLVSEKRKFKRKVRKWAQQEGKIAKEERKLTKPEEKMQRKEKPTKDKKKLTHPEEKMAQEEEIRASSQKELVMEDQRLVLEEKRLTRKRGKLLGKGKEVIRKKRKPTLKKERLEWEKMQAHKEVMSVQEEELAEEDEELAREEEELVEEEEEMAREEEELVEEEEEMAREEEELAGEEEELAGEEEKLAEEEEELAGGEEELAWEEEELAWEEEELAEEKEALILDTEKQVRERKKHIWRKEKRVEEEAWELGKMVQDHLSVSEEGLSRKKREQTLERESLAEQESKLIQKKKWFGKEALYGKHEEQDQTERRAQREEKEAKESKQLAWERKKLYLEDDEKFGELDELSQEEEKLAQKMEQEAEKRKRAREKMKQVSEEKTIREEIEKGSPKEEKQPIGKEKKAKKKKKQIGKDEKAIEEEEQWTKEKLALQKEKLAQEERKKDKKWSQKDEKEVEPKKRQVRKKEKLALEEGEQAGQMEEQFQEKEEEAKGKKKRALAKRLAPEDSEVAKKESHIAEKEKATSRERIGITKKKKKITQEEKEMIKEEDELAQEDRQLAYDIKTKERDVAKKKKKTKEERKQAMRKLDMEKGVGSEEKEARSREENIRMKENQLFGILAGIIRELITVPSEEREITEEEISIIEKSEIDGHRWEFFKKQEEIIEEGKEQAQRDRKLEDRLATKERTLTDKEGSEEDRKFLEEVQEKIIFNKIQVQTMLKEFQKINLLEKRQIQELLKRIEEHELEKTQMKWLLDNLRGVLFEDLYKSLTEKETEEGLIMKGKEEDILPKKEKRIHLIKKKEVSTSEEELEDNLAKKLKEKGLTQTRKMEKSLKERLSKKKEGPREEEESLSEEEWGRWSEEEEEMSLSEEEEESVGEEEESISEEEKEEESLSEEEESQSEEEEEEKMEEKEKEEEDERQKDVESLRKENEKESRLMEGMFSEEERVLKTKLSKEEVRLSKLVIEGEDLAEKRESTAKGEGHFKKEGFLDVRRDSRLMDKAMWPTVLKSPSKIPFQITLEGKKRMPLKVSEDHWDLEDRQGSQLLGVHSMTSSLGRQENELLEKARGMFLQAMETGLETQVSEGRRRPEFQLSDTFMEPQKPKHRPKSERWKWFLGYQDSLMGETEGQAPAPAPAPAFSPEMAGRKYRRPAFSEASFSDEDWINNALKRLEAGKQLSRESFHQLSQILRDFNSKRYLKLMRLSNLKAIAKHIRQNLELSHADTLQPCKDVLSPVHLKEIPPIRRKETDNWLEPFSIPEPVLPSAIKRTQTPQALSWHLLAESYRKKQAQQLSTALKEIKHLYPVRRDVPTAVCPSVDKKSLALKLEKDFPALRRRGEISKFPMTKKEALPMPAPAIPSITKRIQDPKAINWHLLGEPYRTARVQRLSDALKEMERQHVSATRDIFTGAHASVDKQTLALMFQKDLRAFKGKGRPPKLPKLEKAKPISKKKEERPLWETFVALYHVLRMLRQRYGKDSTAWMEQFNQLMELYQLKSPRIQRLLLELVQGEQLQPQETIYPNALETKELVEGERLFYHLFCGHSHGPAGPLKFQNVVPLPGQNRVHAIQSEGIAQYGFLELAWKSLPQVDPHRIGRLPSIPTPTL